MVGNLDITDGTGRTVAFTEEVQGDDVEEDNATVRRRPFRDWTEYKLSVLRDDDLPAKHPRPSKAHLQYRSSASESASQESHSQQPQASVANNSDLSPGSSRTGNNEEESAELKDDAPELHRQPPSSPSPEIRNGTPRFGEA